MLYLAWKLFSCSKFFGFLGISSSFVYMGILWSEVFVDNDFHIHIYNGNESISVFFSAHKFLACIVVNKIASSATIVGMGSIPPECGIAIPNETPSVRVLQVQGFDLSVNSQNRRKFFK